MTRRSAAGICASLVLVWGLFAGSGIAHVDGPPPAMTGGFGEESCQSCHFDSGLNDPAGFLRLDGIPDTYAPDQEYVITVRLSHPALERGGFELAARFASGRVAGQQAGRLEAAGGNVSIVRNGEQGVEFARQTREGVAPESTGSIAWQLRWRAPRDPQGAVIFHAAANAANFDESPLGDFPYMTSVTIQP